MSTPTFSIVEMLPDGRRRVLARGLSLSQARAYVLPAQTWAITYLQEGA